MRTDAWVLGHGPPSWVYGEGTEQLTAAAYLCLALETQHLSLHPGLVYRGGTVRCGRERLCFPNWGISSLEKCRVSFPMGQFLHAPGTGGPEQLLLFMPYPDQDHSSLVKVWGEGVAVGQIPALLPPPERFLILLTFLKFLLLERNASS